MDEHKALRVMRTMVDGGQLTDPDSARGKLLQTAAHLFRNKGFERTTVRDLASAVGIQSGSIFHHFKSKDEIDRPHQHPGCLDHHPSENPIGRP